MLYSIEDQQHAPSRGLPSVTATVSDEQLMEGIQHRDEDALQTFFRRHTPLLRTIIARVVANDADVDDVTQEVCVELWKHADAYAEIKGKALGWLVTLARRRAIDRIRRKQAYSRAQERFHVVCQHEAESFQPTSVSQAENCDRAEIFQRVLSALPGPQREVIQMAYYGGLSQRDIARRTGIPLGTIKTRLELALRKLRAAILALGGEEEWGFSHA